MPKPVTPSNPDPAAAAAPVASGLDEHLQTFWEKNSRLILAFCGLVLVGIIAKGGWEYFSAQRESGIESEYAAATTPAKLRDFAAAHPDHELAGLAQLQVADTAYGSNQIEDALAAYTQAAAILKTGPFAARAKLGLAMAKIQSGRTDEGEADLSQLMDDSGGFLAVRAEAAYHLASLAAAAGRTADVQRLSTQLLQIDPSSPWAQRAFALRIRQSASGGPKPTASFKAAR